MNLQDAINSAVHLETDVAETSTALIQTAKTSAHAKLELRELAADLELLASLLDQYQDSLQILYDLDIWPHDAATFSVELEAYVSILVADYDDFDGYCEALRRASDHPAPFNHVLGRWRWSGEKGKGQQILLREATRWVSKVLAFWSIVCHLRIAEDNLSRCDMINRKLESQVNLFRRRLRNQHATIQAVGKSVERYKEDHDKERCRSIKKMIKLGLNAAEDELLQEKPQSRRYSELPPLRPPLRLPLLDSRPTRDNRAMSWSGPPARSMSVPRQLPAPHVSPPPFIIPTIVPPQPALVQHERALSPSMASTASEQYPPFKVSFASRVPVSSPAQSFSACSDNNTFRRQTATQGALDGFSIHRNTPFPVAGLSPPPGSPPGHTPGQGSELCGSPTKTSPSQIQTLDENHRRDSGYASHPQAQGWASPPKPQSPHTDSEQASSHKPAAEHVDNRADSSDESSVGRAARRRRIKGKARLFEEREEPDPVRFNADDLQG